jgi:hypothetical protein
MHLFEWEYAFAKGSGGGEKEIKKKLEVWVYINTEGDVGLFEAHGPTVHFWEFCHCSVLIRDTETATRCHFGRICLLSCL